MRLNYAIASDRGLVRSNNEDSAYAGPHLLALADGMGGHAAGEVASQIMIHYISKLDVNPEDNDMLALLGAIADDANRALAKGVRENPATEGMGTTLSALMFNGQEFGLIHVGDSRGYLLRKGKLHQITMDDTYVQSLVNKGELSPDDVSTHPQRSMILKAYAGRPVEPFLKNLPTRPGDRVMLCSDGLSDPVTNKTIAQTLREGTPQEAVTRLVELALRSGGPDNVTVVVADVVDDSFDPEQLPKEAVMAGAPVGDQQSFPRADTAAGRAALAFARLRQPGAVEPSAVPVPAPKKKRKFRLAVFFLTVMMLLAAIGGGLWGLKSYAKNRYFITTSQVTDVSDAFVINQGLDSSILGDSFHSAYQYACISPDAEITLVDVATAAEKLSNDSCQLFRLMDIKESARAGAATLPSGNYDEAQQQIKRLASEALPVCVIRENHSETTTTRAGDLNSPGVNCREVK